eukprot:gene3288-3742_t
MTSPNRETEALTTRAEVDQKVLIKAGVKAQINRQGQAEGDFKSFKPREKREGDARGFSGRASGSKDFKSKDGDSKGYSGKTGASRDFKPRTPRDGDSKSFRPRENRDTDAPASKGRSYVKKDNFSSDKPFRKFDDKKGQASRSTDSRPFRKRAEEGSRPNFKEKGEKTPVLRSRKTPVAKDDGLIRLNRYIANSGICSRRKADELIAAGVVTVNNEVVSELGHKVDPAKDSVRYNGELLKREKKIYVLLNKPKDYITTTDDPQERKTVMQLVEKASRERIYPVGRLDRNTTGLLLMTNDGDLADKLAHPKNGITKIYHVELSRSLSQGDLNKIQFGLELEDGLIKPDSVSYVAGGSKKEVGIQIHSGKNRIVRRIFEHLGYDVVKLDRVVYGNLTKKDLPRGRWRYLEEKILCLLSVLLLCAGAYAQKANYNLLIGTYTNTGKSEGIYTYNFHTFSASSRLKSITKEVANPSYLCVSPDKKFVYSVNETGSTSTISAFAFNALTGKLTFLNKKESHGADPCYITADQKNVIVANYSGGSLAVFGRNADGSLSDAVQVIQHTGKSIDPKKRQESAHVHMVQFSPDRKYLICNDLGEDQIYVYHYNPSGKNQTLTIKTVLKTNAGSGPRHFTFSPNGRFAYLAHEFNGSITAFVYANGTLNKIQEIGTTDKDFSGRIDGADVHVSPDGKFLYESNRGDANSISIFSILPTGKLSFVSTVSSLGKGPRNFAIDPSGNYLLAAHQYTNDVVIFKRNKTTGLLKDSGKRLAIGAPVCLVFTP